MKPWPKVRLGEVLHEQDNSVPATELSEVNLAGVYSFARGLFKRGPMSPGERSYKSYNRLVTDDFVISTPKAWEGALALVTPEFDGWFLSPVFPTFRFNREQLLPKFLEWYCRRESVWGELQRKSRGIGARRESVHPEQFLSLEIPLPPLAEQRAVVARIEELAAHIHEARTLRHQATEEAEALVAAKASTVFRAAMENGSATLESVALLERGKFHHRPRNEPRFFGGDHPWIQIGEIESCDKYIRTWTQTLNDDGLAISKKFPRGTVLISIAATIGAVGILDFDCCVPDSIVGVTPKPQTDSEFLYHYLGYLRGHLEEIAPQSAQKNINLGILTVVPVPKLALPEQRRIVAELDALQAEVDALKRLQAETAAQLDALLPAILDRAFKRQL